MLLFGIFFRSCDPYALAAAAVLSILLQFLSIARVSRDHKLGPHSRKSLNLEGVDDSAVKKTAGGYAARLDLGNGLWVRASPPAPIAALAVAVMQALRRKENDACSISTCEHARQHL